MNQVGFNRDEILQDQNTKVYLKGSDLINAFSANYCTHYAS